MAVVGLRDRAGVTVRLAADRFLSSTRCANPNTRRAYASVLDRLVDQLGADRPLAGVAGEEVTAALTSVFHVILGDTRVECTEVPVL